MITRANCLRVHSQREFNSLVSDWLRNIKIHSQKNVLNSVNNAMRAGYCDDDAGDDVDV